MLHPYGIETTIYLAVEGARVVPADAGTEVLRRPNVQVFNGDKLVQLLAPSQSFSSVQSA